MLKKIVSCVTACALVVSLAAVSVVAAELIYDGVASGDMKTWAADTSNNTDYLQLAGSPTIAYEDGKGIIVTGRTADWNAVDVLLAKLADGPYTLEVDFAADEEVDFGIVAADAPYTWYVTETGKTVTLKYDFTVKGGKSDGQNRLRVRENSTKDYTIVNIKIYSNAAAPAAEEPEEEDTTEEAPAPAPSVLTDTDVLSSDGVLILRAPGSYGGAFIDTSKLTVGSSYKVEYVITTLADHNGGFRVRYADAIDNANHNDGGGDPAAHSSDTAKADGYTANQVPANFPNETVPGGTTVTLTVNFTLGANIADLDPLTLNYIGIFGYWGSADYDVDEITLYDASGAKISQLARAVALVETPVAEAPVPEAPAPVAPAPGAVSPASGNTAAITIFAVMALAGAAAVVSRKRK
jgi:hypothetical protein